MHSLKSLLFALFFFPLMALAHPLKMSFMYVKYHPESETVQLNCRVFGEDLERAVEEELGQKVGVLDWTLEERTLINTFFNKHVKISFGGVDFQLEVKDTNYDRWNDLLTLNYEFSAIKLKQGDEISIANDLFFKQFKGEQSTIYELDIPKVVSTTVECTVHDYKQIFTVGNE